MEQFYFDTDRGLLLADELGRLKWGYPAGQCCCGPGRVACGPCGTMPRRLIHRIINQPGDFCACADGEETLLEYVDANGRWEGESILCGELVKFRFFCGSDQPGADFECRASDNDFATWDLRFWNSTQYQCDPFLIGPLFWFPGSFFGTCATAHYEIEEAP